MARRKLSLRAEEELIREAERLKDADTEPGDLRISSNATAVLSVRLPMSEVRALRGIAERRGVSLSALLQSAVEKLMASEGPSVSYSRAAKGFAVSGATLAASEGDEPASAGVPPENVRTGTPAA